MRVKRPPLPLLVDCPQRPGLRLLDNDGREARSLPGRHLTRDAPEEPEEVSLQLIGRVRQDRGECQAFGASSLMIWTSTSVAAVAVTRPSPRLMELSSAEA